jgi:peptide/nickel transport system ATP-binding protein
MSAPVLSVEGLVTTVASGAGEWPAVDGISFQVGRGETFALVGESGCGKSLTALSIARLLPAAAATVAGRVVFDGRDLLALPERAMRDVRGRRLAMVFQEPATSLNPVMTVGDQVREVLARHLGCRGPESTQRVVSLFEAVGIPDPVRRLAEFPFQLSGGLRQRVMIAMAIACEPDLLIADEPTTALDVTLQAQVLELLAERQRRTGMAVLLITHDLAVVAQVAHRVGVMYAGQLVETAPAVRFFEGPRHPYARQLLAALPGAGGRDRPLASIPGAVPAPGQMPAGCRFEPRCHLADTDCALRPPRLVTDGDGAVRCLFPLEPGPASLPAPDSASAPSEARATADALLEVSDLQVRFPVRGGLFRRVVGEVRAVDGVTLCLAPGRTLAIVGESGCGKTTLGRALVMLQPVQGGRVVFEGEDLAALSPGRLRARRSRFQMVFQDPFSSLDPRLQVQEILQEGMLELDPPPAPALRAARTASLLEQVGLDADCANRYPHEFSGGQRQRIAIARALAVEPKLLVCDEPTSALDVSVQAQILNLLRDLQQRLDLAYVFITHNLAVVEHIAHEVAVMYLGRVVEQGSVQDVLGRPAHPYTRALLASMPVIGARSPVPALAGELPSPVTPPTGCHFHPRCPQALPECASRYPEVTSLPGGHRVRCHLHG